MSINYSTVSGWGIEIDYADCKKMGWKFKVLRRFSSVYLL